MKLLFNLLFYLPGIAAAVFTLKSVECLLPLKKGYLQKGLLLTGCFLLSAMIIFIGDLDNLPATFLIFLFCVLFCCDGSILQKITIGLMLASTAFACNALIDNTRFHFSMTQAFLRLAFWIIFYLFLRHYAPEKEYQLSPSLWKLLLFLTCLPLGIVLSIVLLADEELPVPSNPMTIYYVLLALALFAFIGLLQAINVLAKQQRLEHKSRLIDVNRKYYETLEQQQFEVRRLKHDMSNHLQVLNSLPDSDKADYVNHLLKTSALSSTVQYCADQVVNAVISNKTALADSHRIEFYINANIPASLPFEKVDICTIFANALDNAIEHCAKLPDGEREIYLESHIRKGMFVLKVTNPCKENSLGLSNNFLPKTSKKDALNHGYGLKSIRETVLQYHGHMEIQTEGGQFILFLYIPT